MCSSSGGVSATISSYNFHVHASAMIGISIIHFAKIVSKILTVRRKVYRIRNVADDAYSGINCHGWLIEFMEKGLILPWLNYSISEMSLNVVFAWKISELPFLHGHQKSNFFYIDMLAACVVLWSVHLDLVMDFTLLISLFIHKRQKLYFFKYYFAEVISDDFSP